MGDAPNYYKEGDYIVLVGQPNEIADAYPEELIGKISSVEFPNFVNEINQTIGKKRLMFLLVNILFGGMAYVIVSVYIYIIGLVVMAYMMAMGCVSCYQGLTSKVGEKYNLNVSVQVSFTQQFYFP